jgi:hypothetical protein
MNMLGGIPVINNYDPLVPARYAEWMDELESINIHYRDDWLNVMGVSVLEWATSNSNYGMRFIPRDGATRVRWVPCARYVTNEDTSWDLVFTGEFDLSNEVIIENAGVKTDQSCTQSNVTPKIVTDRPNEIIIQVNSRFPGWIVLSDVWYLGWKGWLDGDPAPIYHANYLFRAVEVPPGSHEITFAYRPPWFYIGAVLSGFTCISLGIILTNRKR